MYPLMNVSTKPSNDDNDCRLKEGKEKHFTSNLYVLNKTSAEHSKTNNKTNEKQNYKESGGIHNNLLCGFVKIVVSIFVFFVKH
jgi:hypothetical protein